MISLSDKELAQENIKRARLILTACKYLESEIKKLKDPNESRLILALIEKADLIWQVNEVYIEFNYTSDIDLANDSLSLFDDIWNLTGRLHPTIEAMRDRILMQSLIDIAHSTNKMLILNKEYSEKNELILTEWPVKSPKEND